jgi:hypothetical protein
VWGKWCCGRDKRNILKVCSGNPNEREYSDDQGADGRPILKCNIIQLEGLILINVENCAILCHYADSSGNSLPTFRDNLSVPPSWVKNVAQARDK